MIRSIVFITCLLLGACQNRNAIENIEIIPEFTEADQAFANAFSKLDGRWRGKFYIFQDSLLLPRTDLELRSLNLNSLSKPGVYLTDSLNVLQVYTSINPYFQRVEITDIYPDGKKVSSKGVNKVQNGELWCVVQKPEELIVHEGSLEGKGTIIWASSTSEKEEYFYETVNQDAYEIIGWGYYGSNADRSLSPPMWFYARYVREGDEGGGG